MDVSQLIYSLFRDSLEKTNMVRIQGKRHYTKHFILAISIFRIGSAFLKRRYDATLRADNHSINQELADNLGLFEIYVPSFPVQSCWNPYMCWGTHTAIKRLADNLFATVQVPCLQVSSW